MSERHLAWYYSYSKVSIWAAVIIITQIKFMWFPATFKTNNNLISMIYDYALRLYLQFYLFAFFFARNSLSSPDTNPLWFFTSDLWGFHDGSVVKKFSAIPETQGTWIWSLGQEDHLEKEIATHSNI